MDRLQINSGVGPWEGPYTGIEFTGVGCTRVSEPRRGSIGTEKRGGRSVETPVVVTDIEYIVTQGSWIVTQTGYHL